MVRLVKYIITAALLTASGWSMAQDTPQPEQPPAQPPAESPTQPVERPSANEPEQQVTNDMPQQVVKSPRPAKKSPADSSATTLAALPPSAALPPDSAALLVAALPNNPFDLAFRLTGTQPQNLPDSAAVTQPANPFEVRITNRLNSGTSALSRLPMRPLTETRQSVVTLYAITVAMLLFLALALSLNRKTVATMYESMLNDSTLRISFKEQTSYNRSPYYLMYVVFLVNAALFLYLLIVKNKIAVPFSHWMTLLVCFAAVVILFLGKLVVLRFIGWLLPVQAEVRFYRFILIAFGILFGLVLSMANIFIAFGEQQTIAVTTRLTLILLAILLVIRIGRSLFLSRQYFSRHTFHFLLYLCALEIAPVALIVRFLTLMSR